MYKIGQNNEWIILSYKMIVLWYAVSGIFATFAPTMT